MKITHTVFKNKDVEALPHRFQLMLNRVANEIMGTRRRAGKDPSPNYIVVNTDEPYAHEIQAIIDREHGGDPSEG